MSVRTASPLLLLLGLGFLGRADAQPNGEEPPAKFQVFLAGSPEAKGRVRDELRELLSRAGLTAEPRDLAAIDPRWATDPGPQPPGVLGQVWLDLAVAANDRAMVYVRDCSRRRVLVRSIPLPGGWDEVASEEISHIVSASLVALAAGMPLEIPPPPPKEATEREMSSPVPQQTTLATGLAAGGIRSATGQAVEPALEASFLLGLGPRVALWSTLAVSSSTSDGAPINLRLSEVSLAILPAWTFWHGSSAQGHLSLGPMVGLVIAGPRLASGTVGVEPASTDWAWQVGLRAAARVQARLTGSLAAFVAAACDVAVPSYRYTLTGGPKSITLVETPTVRPSLWLGLAFDLLSGGRS